MRRRSLLFAALAALAATGAAFAGAYEDWFRAIERDDARAVNALVGRGFDPNAVDERGQSGLYLALRGEAAAVAAALIGNAQLQVDAANAQGETPLMMAALRGNVAAARALLERGAAVQRDGWTPLHYAASGPEPQLVTLLLDRGAAIDAPSPNRTTPLMMAARYGAEASVTRLLQRGADTRLRNDKGLDAAAFAREAGRTALAARIGAQQR